MKDLEKHYNFSYRMTRGFTLLLASVMKILLVTLMLLPTTVNGNHYLFTTPVEPMLARLSSVYHISQDKHGFIWFGTNTNGLLRFDGNEAISWLPPEITGGHQVNINYFVFTDDEEIWSSSWHNGLIYYPKAKTGYVFPINQQSPEALASQRVQMLFQDSRGRLWVGAMAGLHFVDLSNPYQIQRLAFSEPEHPLYQQRIWGVTESPEGLWVATSRGIVLLDLDLNILQHFLLSTTAPIGAVRADEIRDIQYINNHIWAGSANGVFRYQQDCRCFVKITTPPPLTDPKVNRLHQGSRGTIWVGADDGLYQLDSNTFKWLKAGEQYNFLPDVDVRSIFLDKDQLLWLGSRERGIFIGHQQHQSFTPLASTLPEEIADDVQGLTTAIYHSKAGALWLASQDKLLYRQADKVTWRSIEIMAQYGIRKVYRITEDPYGVIWLATDVGLFRVDDATLTAVTTPFELAKRQGSLLTDLAISPNGDFYLGLWHHGLLFWQPDLSMAQLELTELSHTSGDLIYHIHQSDSGTLFAATRYSGLFSKKTNHSEWSPVSFSQPSLVDGYHCVLPETDTLLWLCSEFGLWRFDSQTHELTQYSIEHGLPSLFISAAFFDHEQRFWVLTNQGPARFDPDLQRFISYSQHDGLPDLNMQRHSFSVSQEGEMLLGTPKGAVVAHIDLEKENLAAPSVVISRLFINGVDHSREYQQGSTQLELPSSYRELVIGYALLDYHDSEMHTTRSRLLGLSDRWTVQDTHHEVRYINLPPGHYTLEIEGQNARGIRSAQPLRLDIIVKAPWWKTTWLWLVVTVVLFFVTLGFMQLQKVNLNKRNQRLQTLVLARTRELEALAVKLKQRAEHDPLTGLLNRAGFTERFNRLRQSCAQQNQTLTLVLIDIDHFKRLNDQYGHNAGDKVLQHFSELLRSRVRVSDCVGRWGGEEFIIALGHCQESGAQRFCEQLLASLKQDPCIYHQSQLYYTATFGIVCLPINVDTLDTWIKSADDALYQGKASGRAQVVMSSKHKKSDEDE